MVGHVHLGRACRMTVRRSDALRLLPSLFASPDFGVCSDFVQGQCCVTRLCVWSERSFRVCTCLRLRAQSPDAALRSVVRDLARVVERADFFAR